jgi:hypothetical protein
VSVQASDTEAETVFMPDAVFIRQPLETRSQVVAGTADRRWMDRSPTIESRFFEIDSAERALCNDK